MGVQAGDYLCGPIMANYVIVVCSCESLYWSFNLLFCGLFCTCGLQKLGI